MFMFIVKIYIYSNLTNENIKFCSDVYVVLMKTIA